MWIYESSTGLMLLPNGKKLGYGFAGHGHGLNYPPYQNEHNVGPLPENNYKMTNWVENDPHLGLGVIILEPLIISHMFGRSAFRIHGATNLFSSGLDRFLHSSEGCICIGDLATRRLIWQHDDDFLKVIAKIY